jgi:hypothetical protein
MCVSGWAANDADFNQPVHVEILVNSRVAATLPCVRFREDLRAAGIGDGCKGFEFAPDAYLVPGRNVLEVRYAGADVVVPKGRGQWVRRRKGAPAWETACIAALEAYCEFKPDHHVCAVGVGSRDLERAFRESGIPFRRFTSLEDCGDPAAIRSAEKADALICWATSTPCVETVRLLLDSTNSPGLVALGFVETAEAPAQIRQVFEKCGVPAVKLESIALAPGQPGIFAFAQLGNVAAVRESAVPVFAHIHVPKCAGTSFRVLLERHFGPRHLRLYVNDTYFVYGDEALRNYLLQDPEIRGFSSHHVRSFPRWLAGREMLYVTFLRDPIEQFVSFITHVKKLYRTITATSLLEAVPPDAPKLTLREFAKWLLTQDRDIPFRENHNVNFFARHSSPTPPDRLEAAKAALDGFFFVGIAERMEESMNKLRLLTQAAGLDFPAGPIPIENASSDYRDDLSWIHSGDEVGSLLLRSVEKDRQLYEWAAARFNE